MDSTTELLTKLRSDHPDIAFFALADLQLRAITRGEHPPEVLPELLRMVDDRGSQLKIRQIAVTALPTFAPTNEQAKKAILTALQDPHPFVRREALQALIGMKNLLSEDLDAIRAMASDPDNGVADWSEIALRNIAASNKPKGSGQDPDPIAQFN